MPHSKSAAKRVRQSEKRRQQNKAVKSAIKTQSKKVLAGAEAGDADRARAELRLAVKRLDRAAAKGVMHKNTAARHKSRLTRKVNAVGPAPAGEPPAGQPAEESEPQQ